MTSTECRAPACVCEQCGCGMPMLPPLEFIEQMRPRILCPICLVGVRWYVSDRLEEVLHDGN